MKRNFKYNGRNKMKAECEAYFCVEDIRDYEEHEEEGTFRFNRFYKQLAVAYGLGLRFDLDYLIIRFDGGMKAINPMYSGKEKYPFIHPQFGRDFTFHFAVGYPF